MISTLSLQKLIQSRLHARTPMNHQSRTSMTVRRYSGLRFRVQAPIFFHSLFHFSTNSPNPDGPVNLQPPKSLSHLVSKFHRMLRSEPILPSSFEFSQVLTAISRMGHHSTVLSLYREMSTNQVLAPLHLCTFNIVINSCCRLRNGFGVDYGFSLFGALVKNGFEPNTVTFNTMMKGLFLEGRNGDALRLFNILTKRCKPNVVTYGIVIDGVCKMGNMGLASVLLSDMKVRRFKLNTVIYNVLINGLCKKRRVDSAFSFVGEMVKKGVMPNLLTFSTLIKGLFLGGEANLALKLFHKLPEILEGVRPNQVTFSIVIDGLCKIGNVAEAINLFREMTSGRSCVPNVYIYNALIDGVCQQGRADLALSFLGEMVKEGVTPDLFTFSTLIKGLFLGDEANTALKLFHKLPKALKDVRPDRVTYLIVIDGLCKVGSVDAAITVLRDMKCGSCDPDKQIYNAMMDGLCKNKRVGEAFSLVEEMVKESVFPDVVTYSTMIKGLCEDGRLQDALELFNNLSSKGIQPTVVTYTIMIDGLCNEGSLDEAEELMLVMERNGSKPDEVTFDTMLRGYLKWNQKYKAVEFIQKMVGMNFSPRASSISTLTDMFGADESDCETN